MGRSRFKWKCAFISYLVLLNVFTKSLPIKDTKLSTLTTTDTVFQNAEVPLVADTTEELTTENSDTTLEIRNDTDVTIPANISSHNLLRNIRPGQEIRQYAIELTDEGNTFSGRIVIDIVLTQATREDPIVLHADGLDILSVKAGVFTDASAVDVGFNLDGQILEIFPDVIASSYIVVIEYTGQYAVGGQGLHRGLYDNGAR